MSDPRRKMLIRASWYAGPPNALVQLRAHYHHCGEAASEKCSSAATFVRLPARVLGLDKGDAQEPSVATPYDRASGFPRTQVPQSACREYHGEATGDAERHEGPDEKEAPGRLGDRRSEPVVSVDDWHAQRHEPAEEHDD